MRPDRRLALVLLSALLLCPIPATAQLAVGGRFGVNNSAALFEDEHSGERIDAQPGPVFSGILAYRPNAILSLQLELTFIQKGWAEPQTGGGRRLSYLEVPLLLSVNAPWTVSPHLLFGPSVSLEVGCSVTGVPDVGTLGCGEPEVAWERSKTQVGLWFGLGVGRRLGRGRLALQLMGNVGLTDLNREALPRGYITLVAATGTVVYQVPLGGL
jgi:hypothetical protein